MARHNIDNAWLCRSGSFSIERSAEGDARTATCPHTRSGIGECGPNSARDPLTRDGPSILAALAEGYSRVGQPIEGLNCLAESVQIVETTGERYSEAEIYRLRGDLSRETRDDAAAESSYHKAIAVAEHQNAKLFEFRAAASLARLWRDQRTRTEARDLLAPIYGWFTQGFDTPVLQDAKALLDQLA
jgi:predicted ATPase